jgi:hypothetical protein
MKKFTGFGMVVCSLAAAGGDPVERLATPRLPGSVDAVDPVDWFTDIVDDGTVFGRTYDPLSGEQATFMRIGPDGDVVEWDRFDPAFGDVYVLRSFSPDGNWVIALTQNYPPTGVCRLGELTGLVAGATAFLRVDLRTNQPEFLSPCPYVFANDLSSDGERIAGSLSLEYDPVLYIAGPSRPFIWETGDIRVLDLPDAEPGSVGLHCSATGVSADGRIVAGGLSRPISDLADRPFSRAVVWTDGVPHTLPHFPGCDGEVLASSAGDVSTDGTTIVGHTSGYGADPQPAPYPDEWVPVDSRSWRYRDGVFDDLSFEGMGFNTQGITDDGSLVYGLLNAGHGTRTSVVWTEAFGSVTASAYMRGLGIDLAGTEIEALNSVSDNGHWMLVTLRVGGGFEQDARIRIPCSPADLIADRSITVNDAIAYAERFTAANPLADLTGDDVLDLADIARFVALYGAGCPG